MSFSSLSWAANVFSLINIEQMIRVHSYESLGTYDGPGIRLVVFLQGCNFRCLYCANPDTIDAKGESKETAPEDILKMAVSQKPFFGKKGGITFSGGEPTFQAKALIPLFLVHVGSFVAVGVSQLCLSASGACRRGHAGRLRRVWPEFRQ